MNKGAIIGATHVEAVVTGPTGRKATARFLVDSGASYTLLPQKVWKRLGLKPKRTELFALADGTTIEREVSEAHVALANADGHTPVILGENGDQPLLGVVTLENLGLVLNPFSRKLQPMRLLLA